MRVLCSFPGKSGDLLWACATFRAISSAIGASVDLWLSEQYGGPLEPLLRQQSYIGHVYRDGLWKLQDTAPISPREPPTALQWATSYDRVCHLGYKGWPMPDVARATYQVAQEYFLGKLPALELERPWISIDGPAPPTEIVVGFTDEHFELKYGLSCLLEGRLQTPMLAVPGPGSRWLQEHPGGGFPSLLSSWAEAAGVIRNADLFVGCNSALHVLAVALGKPVVMMEPQSMRHNDVFFPLGKKGRVHLVTGNDGQPTHDARHVAEAIEAALKVEVQP